MRLGTLHDAAPRRSRVATSLLLMAACLASMSLHARAHAQDKPPYLMTQPAEYTNVLDAFEDDDPLDFNVRLGFTRSTQSSTIQREVERPLSGGGSNVDFRNLAHSSHVVNQLNLELATGIYHDLMLYGRLPLVLSDTRELSLASSCQNDRSGGCRGLANVVPNDTTQGQLLDFDPNPTFRAKTRSGVPAFELGLAWGIVNQFHKPDLPSWVVSIEGRFSVGTMLRPARYDESFDPGLSRGTTRLKLESRWSYRFRYLEPYTGLSYAFEWAGSGGAWDPSSSNRLGYVSAGPPDVGEATLGVEIVPWEQRGRFQRLAIDLEGRAGYVTAGRDFSPLFDAIGSGELAKALDPSAPAPGLTNVAGHGRVSFEAALAMQAASYVRFRLGLRVAYTQTHLISGADMCNTDNIPSNTADVGGCRAPNGTTIGTANRLYDPYIDAAGTRFRAASDFTLDLFASAVGQF